MEAIKRIKNISNKRQAAYIMQRLRKGREIEQKRDIREVQRDMPLIRSPAAGMFFFFYIVNVNSKLFLLIFLWIIFIVLYLGLRERLAEEQQIVEEIHESDTEMELVAENE